MPRLMLCDEFWSKLRRIMYQQNIYDKDNLRLTVEGILYRMRTGCPWRDLPEYFGHWNSIYKRFNEWSDKGKLMKLFQSIIDDPDLEWEFMDGSIVKAHQHSAGGDAKGQAIGDSRGGKTTKIHLVTDAYGLPIVFDITGGQVHDVKAAPGLVDLLPQGQYVITDKGYDSDPLRQQIAQKSMTPMIPKKANSKTGNDHMDWALYKYRHLVENAFARLKHFRAIATRYDKLKRNYQGMLAFACCFMWLPIANVNRP